MSRGPYGIMQRSTVCLASVCLASVALADGGQRPGAAPVASRPSAVSLMRAPLAFEANQGQYDRRVRFAAHGGGATVFLTDAEAVIVLPGRRIGATPRSGAAALLARREPASVLRMKMVGAGRPAASGEQKLPGIANRFIGRDPRRWRTGIATYGRARFAGVYPGTDLVYYGNPQRLEYDFELKPGADPGRIRLAFDGAQRLSVAANGDLVAATRSGDVRLKRPYAYQMIGGNRVQVACDYDLAPDGRTRSVAFRVARYDSGRPLVVDPTLEYSTLLGGAGDDGALCGTVDASGSAYLAGASDSADFPVTPGGISSPSTDYSVFVTKLTPDGTGLVYSTLIGGSGMDYARGIAVDPSGAAYLTGVTTSSTFPVTPGAAQPMTGGGASDGFVVKLAASGTSLLYSTYYGGSGPDYGNAIAIDGAGAAYVVGRTASSNLPVTPGAFAPALPGPGGSGFVAKLNATGSSLDYSTYLGGSGAETGAGAVGVDAGGNAYVCGATQSTDFPVTPGAFQTALGGGADGYVTKLNPTGTFPIYSTYLGGSGADAGVSIAVDAAGSAYVAGYSSSANFPVSPGAFQTSNRGVTAAIVSRLNAAGTDLLYSTFIGGGVGNSFAQSIAVDRFGLAFVTGQTTSTDFPTTPGAYSPANRGGSDAFLARVNATGTSLLYSTCFGGGNNDYAMSVALDPVLSAYIAGYTSGDSATFPTTPGAFQPGYRGGYDDSFAAKFRFTSPTALALSPVTGAIGQTVTLSATLTGDGGPLVGRTVSFAVEGVAVGSAVTNASGVAGRSYTISDAQTVGVKATGASFDGDPDYRNSSSASTLTVNRADTALAVSPVVGQIGETVTLSATLTRTTDSATLAGRTVSFTVAGVSAGSGTTGADGAASVSYTIPESLGVGDAAIGAAYAGDARHNASTGSGTLSGKKGATVIAVANRAGAVGATITLSATITRYADSAPLAGKTLSFTVAGATVGSGVTDASGVATCSYQISEALGAGQSYIGAAFAGDALYAAGSGLGVLTVSTSDTALAVPAVSGAIGATVNLTATLTRTTDGGLLSGRTVTFSVAGTVVGTAVTSSSGVATRSYTIPESAGIGALAIGASYGGEAAYNSSTGSGTLTVSRSNTLVVVPASAGTVGATVSLSATLTRTSDTGALAGKTVVFTVAGVAAGSATTDATGVATVSWVVVDSIGSGAATISASFAGDTLYNAGSGTGTLTISKAATALAVDSKPGVTGAAVSLTATLTRSADGALLSGKSVTFTVGGAAAGTGTTTASGVATVSYTVPASGAGGPLAIAANFAGDTAYQASSGSGTLSTRKATWIFVGAKTKAICDKMNLTATLYGTYGSVKLVGRTLTFAIDGVAVGSSVTLDTPNQGMAVLSYTVTDALGVGVHDVTVSFAGDSTYADAIGVGTLTVTAAPTATTTYGLYFAPGGAAQLKAVLNRLDGFMAGKTIQFRVDGVVRGTGITDVKGQAIYNWTAPAATALGSHTLTAEFLGDAWNLPSSNTAVLTCIEASWIYVSNKSAAIFTKINISGQLRTTPGNRALIGKTVAFQVDGVSIGSALTTATPTNGAAWIMAYPVTEALAPGTHSITATFAGDTEAMGSVGVGTLTVSKGVTYTTAYDLPVILGGTVTMKGTLSSPGGYVPGKTLNFSVDGVFVRSVVTNAAGLAAFSFVSPVTLLTGAHTISVTYAGDATSLASSATATLTVAKENTSMFVSARTVEIYQRPNLGAQLKGLPLSRGLVGKTVNFTLDGVSIGSAVTTDTPVSGGAFLMAFPIPDTLTIGSHTLGASFAGDADANPVSGSGILTVNRATTYLTGANVTAGAGKPTTLSGTLSYNGGFGVGKTLTFYIDGVSVGTAVTNASGKAQLPYTVAVAVGSHTIRVDFAADSALSGNSATNTLTVTP